MDNEEYGDELFIFAMVLVEEDRLTAETAKEIENAEIFISQLDRGGEHGVR